MYLDENEVENLRVVYNKEHPSETPVPKGSMHTVWKELRKRLHGKCKTNECVITTMLEKPTAPTSWAKNTHEWLSSVDIDKIEKQYTKLFSDYYYIGTLPIDFDKHTETGTCLVSSLCSMDIQALYNKGYHKIGIVFNTDVSTGPGQHWIAVYCDISPELEYPRITYFDSYANKPEKEIQRLMSRWKEHWDATKIHAKPMETTYNSTRHQFQNSECGMYCLYFHYCCLLGISMKKRVPDDVVRGLRGLLFRVIKK